MKISNKDHKLLSLYNTNDSFNVPYYQRNYSWDKKQIQTLLDDIFFSKSKYKNKNNHFLGVVVSKEEKISNDEVQYELIDGQQRLTTLSIFVKVILNYIDNNKINLKKSIVQELQKFLWKSKDGIKRIRLQLDNEQTDNTIYNEIIGNRPVSNKKNLISEAYYIIIDYVNDKQMNSIELEKIISIFLNMQLVHIILEKNEDNPQNVFESLNSKGLDLSNVDLIKNYLFMNIISKDRQTELYKNYWRPIEHNLKKDKYIEAFFRDLLTLKSRKYIEKPSAIYYKFTDLYKNISDNEIENILIEINYFMKIYVSVTKNYEKSLIKNSDQNVEFYNFLNSQTSHFFGYSYTSLTSVMWLYLAKKYNDNLQFKKSLVKIMAIINKYIVRWELAFGVGNLHEPLVRIINDLENKISDFEKQTKTKESDKNFLFPYSKEVKNIIYSNLKGQFSYPTDEDIKLAIYGKISESITKYVFKTIEKNKNKNYNESYTFEHIRPKDSSVNGTSWEYEEFHNQIVSKFGNLAYMESEINGQASNKSFSEKKDIYKTSNSYTLKTIDFNLEKWRNEEINERTNILLKYFLEYFSI